MAKESAQVTQLDGVRVSRVAQRDTAPAEAAFVLFHPGLLLRHALAWAVAAPARVCRLVLPLVGALAVFACAALFFLPLTTTVVAVATVVGGVLLWNQPRPTFVTLVEPQDPEHASAESLAALLQTHRAAFAAALRSSGAILFRGFTSGSVDEFEQILEGAGMQAIQFFGQAPRKQEAGWKYVFRNVAFEAPNSGKQGLYEKFLSTFGLVWSWTPAFLNFHNELAYLDPKHQIAQHGVFCCAAASEAGGYTPIANAGNIRQRLLRTLPELPVAMRWALTRKRRDRSAVPRKPTGSYIGFLLGDYELEGVPDQWGDEKSIERRCKELNLEAEVTDEFVTIFSKWIEPSRAMVDAADQITWWCNGNHVSVGSVGQHAADLPWRFRFADGTERPATQAEVYEIAYASWMEACFFSWETGDMLVFDNQLCAHDATPGRGKRSIMPSFGHCFQPAKNN